MKATQTTLLKFLKQSPQFVIPIYQRTYSWTESQCQDLWADILRAGGNNKITAHFIGPIVYVEGLVHVSNQSELLVIDGQQRLTTISLIIEALARHVRDEETVDGFSAEKLRSYYLLNKLESDKRRYKLLLTQTDEQTLISILDQKKWPTEPSLRLQENFAFFEKKINALGDNISSLCKGIEKLSLVDISLSREHDNPQLIFESMNSTGLALSQADLIRNYVLMGLEPDHQTRLYNEHWRPMELSFGQEAYSDHFDGFMRHYLTVKTGEIPKIGNVYEAFKKHSRKNDYEQNIDALVEDVHVFSGYYCAMALGQEPVEHLNSAFHDICELKVDVAYPFLLALYRDYKKLKLSAGDLETAVRLVESYVFRRAICAIPTNSHNKTFESLYRDVGENKNLENIQARFLSLPSYRRLPLDEEFRREIEHRDLYNFRSRGYWLRRLENHQRKERVSINEYTIEHILPQNESSPEWKNELGDAWQHVYDTYLHTLGNLTLTGYNPELGDRPFKEKRDMEGGFKDSPLRVNRGLGDVEVWNEQAIQKRATRLSSIAVEVWKAPSLSAEVLKKYRPEAEPATEYTIESHAYLAKGKSMRPLFDELHKQLLALDPCVSQVCRKNYIAYKAETNFVDVVPQAKQLVLSLSIELHELDDTKELARDVSDIGRWGSGDVEVVLSRPEQLPYIMGLVRQAFEKQMGEG